jgi:hypothetical protein
MSQKKPASAKKPASKAKDLAPKKDAKGGGLKTINHNETLVIDRQR